MEQTIDSRKNFKLTLKDILLLYLHEDIVSIIFFFLETELWTNSERTPEICAIKYELLYWLEQQEQEEGIWWCKDPIYLEHLAHNYNYGKIYDYLNKLIDKRHQARKKILDNLINYIALFGELTVEGQLLEVANFALNFQNINQKYTVTLVYNSDNSDNSEGYKIDKKLKTIEIYAKPENFILRHKVLDEDHMAYMIKCIEGKYESYIFEVEFKTEVIIDICGDD